MDAEFFKTLGQVAGIGGLALGIFLILFRDIVAKNIFPMLSQKDAYRLLRLIAVLVFGVAIFSISAWVFKDSFAAIVAGRDVNVNGNITINQ